MRKSRKNECDEIIDHLIKDYWSKYEEKRKQEISGKAQDFVNRKLFNTTVRVNKQLEVCYQYLDGLIYYLLESITKNYEHIHLLDCKSKLFDVIETEYKQLVNKAVAWLHESNLAQQDMIKQYRAGILDKMGKAKEDVENKCVLLEKQRAGKRWWRNPANIKWLIGTIIAIIGVIIGIKQCSNSTVSKNMSIESKTSVDLSPAVITTGPNSPVTVNYEKDENLHRVIPAKVLYVRTKKKVDELENFLIKEKLTPWRFFRTGKFKVTKYDGKEISYEGEGVEFEGSPRIVFWEGFIEPFIEDGIQKTLDEIGKECQQNNLDPQSHIKEAASLLYGLIIKVYNYMAETDQRLRGKGYPEKVKRVYVEDKIRKMNDVLKEHVEASLALYSNNSS